MGVGDVSDPTTHTQRPIVTGSTVLGTLVSDVRIPLAFFPDHLPLIPSAFALSPASDLRT
jgi:hypothetical protein